MYNYAPTTPMFVQELFIHVIRVDGSEEDADVYRSLHVRTYVIDFLAFIFICALCGLLAVPHRSITFLIQHSGDCAWCRQGEHGPLGRVLITLNLPLGLAATERRIPTRPPILPALYEGDPLPS